MTLILQLIDKQLTKTTFAVSNGVSLTTCVPLSL